MACSATICSCSKDDDNGKGKDIGPSRTVLVYMAAENSLDEFAGSDMQEMLAGLSKLGPNDNLVVFIDDTRLPRLYYLNRKTKAVSINDLKVNYTYKNELNSASAQTLDMVLKQVTDKFKSDTYGLVFWSHGSGWIEKERYVKTRSFGVDNQRNSDSENDGEQMSIIDMASVLKKYKNIEFIFFDSCFMQTIEVAYELKDCAKYILGSPAEIPGEGAPYNYIMMSLFAKSYNPGNTLQAFYDYQSMQDPYGVIVSAIQTSELDNFAKTMKTYFDKYSFLDKDYSGCLNYYMYEKWNTSDVLYRSPDMYDIEGIMKKNLDETEMAEWQKAYDRLVISHYATNSWYSAFKDGFMKVNGRPCGGVAMYLPFEKYNKEQFYKDYKNTAWGKLFNIK